MSTIVANPSAGPTPSLSADRLYFAGDRVVCGSLRCAGTSAHYSGRTIDGVLVVPVTSDDVVDWANADWADLGPMRCEECQRTASPILGADGFPVLR